VQGCTADNRKKGTDNMITLLGALLGFLGSMIPEALNFLREKHDKQHELIILEMQLKQQREGHSQRLDEIAVQHDAQQMQSLYSTFHHNVPWVNALNGSVRPVLAYAFFLLYAVVKLMHLHYFDAALPWQLWGQEDQAIFSAIISFYFGQRAFGKAR
jgi:hypothetical protein